MRDKEFDELRFVEQLEKFYSRRSPRINELRTQVVDNPNFLSENYLVLPFDLKGIIALSLSSWWLPEELGFLIREDIREKRMKRFNLEDQFLIELLLTRKPTSIEFLKVTQIWHSRDFFGNIIQEVMNRLNRLRFRKSSSIVNYPKRKRGYDDHGNKVEDSKWKPKADYTLTEQQNKIEEQRKTQEDTLQFTLGFLD